MKKYENLRFGEERALYGSKDIFVDNCRFQGEEDGESALKECQNIEVKDTFFDLRYPLWHVDHAKIHHCEMSEGCRASLWYDKDVTIDHCQMNGIKAVRECKQIQLNETKIVSPEFGWFSDDIKMSNCSLEGEYPFLKSNHINLDHFDLKGKYSFQYTQNLTICNSNLDTKDAFWHADHGYFENCIVKGEYLAWYSKNLVFKNCTIIGTQPFCYCENLVLENCKMIDCDLSFEKSEVIATISSDIVSVKNPTSGKIIAPHIHEIILDETAKDSTCEIITDK